jgi:uncharacterized protein (TIGR00162 family)
MENIILQTYEKPKLKSPVFVEGLPGVGNVGKLAAEHLIDEMKAKKFAAIFSKHFPPQVVVNEEGLVKLVSNELYYHKAKDKQHKDLVFLVGDYQGLTPEGQYELSDFILKITKDYGVKQMFTLGGYGMGRMVQKPRVFGAATDNELIEEMKKHGVVFASGEPGTGIVGASGLLLGLGQFYGMKSVCLMGETSGYLVDPKSAQAVLEVLGKILDIEIDFTELAVKAKQVDSITQKLKEIEAPREEQDDQLGYIG